jgi:hypothetical protein
MDYECSRQLDFKTDWDALKAQLRPDEVLEMRVFKKGKFRQYQCQKAAHLRRFLSKHTGRRFMEAWAVPQERFVAETSLMDILWRIALEEKHFGGKRE